MFKVISGIVGSLVVVSLIVGLSYWHVYGTSDTVDCLVKKSERVTQNSSEGTKSKYLVFCENEVIENTDSILRWKFNSSDFYSKIEVGQRYTFKVYGWRMPILSWYRNIYSIN